MPRKLKLALFVGGPSRERGISLNSGRSIVDHLAGSDIAIEPIVYIDTLARAFEIDRNLLYCNTPDDFDFKLSGSPALDAGKLRSLLAGVDLAFGAIHGELGEDGALQAQLEEWRVPYVGSGPAACERAYDKGLAARHLVEAGLPGVPSLVCVGPADLDAPLVAGWIRAHGAVVAKPVRGGSSLGISVHTTPEALARHLGDSPLPHGYVVQPFLAGSEFTVVVLEGPNGPVAMPPVEIEIHQRSGHGIFSYRHKYLSTNDSAYHCPPRYPAEVTDRIRHLAAEVFERFELRDFARIDGWYRPDGTVAISDINPISGMEQNSFLFLQTAEIGLSHATALRHVVRRACQRAGVEPPAPVAAVADHAVADHAVADHPGVGVAVGGARLPVPVLFGGDTAERQVSLLSGSNVWLKLRQSARFDPTPYLLRPDKSLWRLPYAAALRHTVEEVEAYCQRSRGDQTATDELRARVRSELALDPSIPLEAARAELTDLPTLLAGTAAVFLGLHGGDGEDGTLQRACEAAGVAFNGPGSAASELCMDKYRTAEALAGLAPEGIYTAAHLLLGRPAGEIMAEPGGLRATWAEVAARLGPPPYVIKPIGDGCSAGVVPLRTMDDLGAYLGACQRGDTRLSGASLSMLDEGYIVEMPASAGLRLMIEQYVATDSVTIRSADGEQDSGLVIGARSQTGWIEVTVGVLGNRGSLRALSPSLTVASDRILSLEEKFMGGTGVNLTPPPVPPLGHVRPEAIEAARARIERVAQVLGLEGYARIDAFMRVDTGEISVIEVNTLPGLTPSTVIFHQALAEPTPMPPRAFLEELLALGLARQADRARGPEERTGDGVA